MTDARPKAKGYKDLASFRDRHRTPTPNGSPASEQADHRRLREVYRTRWSRRLPELFGLLTGVTRHSRRQSPTSTPQPPPTINSGTPDGKRPGRVVRRRLLTSQQPARLVYDEAVAYHEGVPGHHLQIIRRTTASKACPSSASSAASTRPTPKAGRSTLKQLGKEVGFYQDPVSDYGRLNSELFRAVRLVVDTGIHDMGWSRQQVVDFMRNSHAVDEPTIQSETDRYISWPAQACSYKLGQLKIRELRERARTQLGARFDIKTFHDEILSGGSLPLDILDARTTRWIAAQLPANASN